MTQTKLLMAYKEYRDINKGIVEWIIGLTIAELALIISKGLYSFNLIFYVFIGTSFVSILWATVIMYTIASFADVELYSALLAHKSEGEMSEEDFGAEWEKRLGWFGKLLISLVVTKRGYKYLFIFFVFNTIVMFTLIISNIQNIR